MSVPAVRAACGAGDAGQLVVSQLDAGVRGVRVREGRRPMAAKNARGGSARRPTYDRLTARAAARSIASLSISSPYRSA